MKGHITFRYWPNFDNPFESEYVEWHVGEPIPEIIEVCSRFEIQVDGARYRDLILRGLENG